MRLLEVLNLSAETFSRIITKFKKENIIQVKKSQIEILDPKALSLIVETNSIKECTDCIANFKKRLKK